MCLYIKPYYSSVRYVSLNCIRIICMYAYVQMYKLTASGSGVGRTNHTSRESRRWVCFGMFLLLNGSYRSLQFQVCGKSRWLKSLFILDIEIRPFPCQSRVASRVCVPSQIQPRVAPALWLFRRAVRRAQPACCHLAQSPLGIGHQAQEGSEGPPVGICKDWRNS